ncbi:putative cystathionine gamma-synthase [Helianthus annuus]|nr:putative cystathionine gamma-synthase [Helianthus annuus]
MDSSSPPLMIGKQQRRWSLTQHRMIAAGEDVYNDNSKGSLGFCNGCSSVQVNESSFLNGDGSVTIHAGERLGDGIVTDSITTPVEKRHVSFEYGRYGNPTTEVLEEKIRKSTTYEARGRHLTSSTRPGDGSGTETRRGRLGDVSQTYPDIGDFYKTVPDIGDFQNRVSGTFWFVRSNSRYENDPVSLGIAFPTTIMAFRKNNSIVIEKKWWLIEVADRTLHSLLNRRMKDLSADF